MYRRLEKLQEHNIRPGNLDFDRPVSSKKPSHVSAHHDEIALDEIFDVHHAPHQGQPIGGQCENGTDEESIEQQLHVYDGCDDKYEYVV